MMGVEGTIYYSYLLRMWQVPANGDCSWRIQLENIRTGAKRSFGSLEELMAYLGQVTQRENSPPGVGR